MKRFSKSQLLFSVIRSFFWRGIGAIAALLASISVTRTLGAEQSGLYFLGVSIVVSSAAVTCLGFPTLLLKNTGIFIEKHSERVLGLLIRCVVYSTLFITLIVVVWLLDSTWFNHLLNKDAFHLVFYHFLPALFGFALLHQLVQVLLGSGKTQKAILFQSTLIPVGIICLVNLQDFSTAADLASAYSRLTLLVAIAAAITVFLQLRGKEANFTIPLQGWRPMMVMDSATMMVATGGTVIAGGLLIPSEIAQFGASVSVSGAVGLVLISINMVVAPKIAKLHNAGDDTGVRRLAQSSTTFAIVCALPILGIMIFFAEPIMSLFGHEFRAAAPILLVLLAGQAVNVLTGPVAFLLKMCGYEKDLQNITLFNSILALTLFWQLTLHFGVFGASIAASGVIAVNNVAAFFYVYKRLGFSTLAIRTKLEEFK